MSGMASKDVIDTFKKTLSITNPRAKVFECGENISEMGINFLDSQDT